MSNELKTILTTIAENPQARFYVRTDVRRKWKEYDARQVLELIGSRDTKYLQCAVKKSSLVRQSPEVIPWPEKSLAINTKYYAATPELLMRAPVEAAVYKGHPLERKLLELGVVYLIYEDALKRAKAMVQYEEVSESPQDEDIMTFYGTEFDPT